MSELERVIKIVNWLIFEGVADSRKELAELTGYTESSFSQIVNGKVNLSERFIKKLANIDSRINLPWLRTGEGEMLHKPGTNVTQTAKGKNIEQTGIRTGEPETIEKILEEMREQRESYERIIMALIQGRTTSENDK